MKDVLAGACAAALVTTTVALAGQPADHWRDAFYGGSFTGGGSIGNCPR